MLDALIDHGEWIVLPALGVAIVAVIARRMAVTIRAAASAWPRLWTLLRAAVLVSAAFTLLVSWLELASDHHDLERILAILEGGFVLMLIGIGVVLTGAVLAREAFLADALREVRETSREAVNAALDSRTTYPDDLSASRNLTRASIDIRLAELVGQAALRAAAWRAPSSRAMTSARTSS